MKPSYEVLGSYTEQVKISEDLTALFNIENWVLLVHSWEYRGIVNCHKNMRNHTNYRAKNCIHQAKKVLNFSHDSCKQRSSAPPVVSLVPLRKAKTNPVRELLLSPLCYYCLETVTNRSISSPVFW